MPDELRRAERMLARGKYDAVIRDLEPLVLAYRDSYYYYYLLGCAFLRAGDIGGALDCLRRAEHLNFKDAGTQLALAAIHVRKGETEKAVRIYVEILDREPGHPEATRALAYLRAKSGGDGIERAIADGSIKAIYPRHRAGPDPRLYAVLAATALLAAALLAGPPIARSLSALAKPARPGLAEVVLTDAERRDPVSASGGFVYVLTDKEAVEAFERAKRLFSDYRDDAALIECNRIARSNAAPPIKAKAATLRAFAREPSFDALRDFYAYQDVKRDPGLYEDVGVAWKGLAANVLALENGIAFDFLAGYENKKRLDGIVPARASFKYDLAADRPIEILARVKTASETDFWLEVISIHELQDAK